MDLSRPFVVDARGLIHPGCMISSYADVLVPTQLGRRVVRQLTQQPGARAIIDGRNAKAAVDRRRPPRKPCLRLVPMRQLYSQPRTSTRPTHKLALAVGSFTAGELALRSTNGTRSTDSKHARLLGLLRRMKRP